VRLTPTGRAADETTPIEFTMKDTAAPSTKRKRKRKTAASPKRRAGTVVKQPAAPKMKRTAVAADSRVEEALRTWRLLEARRQGVPAFRIFSDATVTIGDRASTGVSSAYPRLVSSSFSRLMSGCACA